MIERIVMSKARRLSCRRHASLVHELEHTYYYNQLKGWIDVPQCEYGCTTVDLIDDLNINHPSVKDYKDDILECLNAFYKDSRSECFYPLIRTYEWPIRAILTLVNMLRYEKVVVNLTPGIIYCLAETPKGIGRINFATYYEIPFSELASQYPFTCCDHKLGAKYWFLNDYNGPLGHSVLLDGYTVASFLTRSVSHRLVTETAAWYTCFNGPNSDQTIGECYPVVLTSEEYQPPYEDIFFNGPTFKRNKEEKKA